MNYGDNFDRASLGSNWIQHNGATLFQIVTNAAGLSAGTVGEGMYGPLGSRADQFAEATLVSRPTGMSQQDISVRIVSNAATYYTLAPSIGQLFYVLFKVVDNNTTQLRNTSTTPTVGDRMRLTAIGSTISAIVNGKVIASVTDTDIPYGYAGIIMNLGSATLPVAVLDNWACGVDEDQGIIGMGDEYYSLGGDEY